LSASTSPLVFPNLRLFFGPRLTIAGRLVMLLFLVVGTLAAGVGNSSPLYLFGFFLLALILTDWFFGVVFFPRVRVERVLPERCAAGARITVTARVTNEGRLPVYDLAVSEKLPWIDVKVDAPVYSRVLFPGESVELSYVLEPTERGSIDFTGPLALTAFPFGLHHTVKRIKAPARMLVYPRFAPLAALDLPVARKHQPGGLALASEVGDSGEYVGNREYRAGDRLRDIHHRAWARVGAPVVREFSQEYLSRIALVADTQVPNGKAKERAALEAGISLGAAVADVLSRQEYVIDVFAAGPDLYHFQAGRSLAHLDNILDILACVDECRTSPFDTLAPAMEEELGKLSSAVLVLLDWDETRERFARSLQESGVAVKVVIVRDGLPSRDPSGFVSEAGAISVLTPAQVLTGVDRL
jgi:uncharacterized protein (DUF58 family)